MFSKEYIRYLRGCLVLLGVLLLALFIFDGHNMLDLTLALGSFLIAGVVRND